jgi:glyoxalase family protein
MDLELKGIHHLTAVTAHARENLAFYTQTLGMRRITCSTRTRWQRLAAI